MTSPPDLVIRGGTIADGKGNDLFEADVAISGGRITEVGKVAAKGKEEIDAKGKLVAPGFVDVHTHYDGQVTWSQDITPSSQNGVTTAIMGARCQTSASRKGEGNYDPEAPGASDEKNRLWTTSVTVLKLTAVSTPCCSRSRTECGAA
jgi:N-acyl-D-aspartate/D-glutamate deacylase